MTESNNSNSQKPLVAPIFVEWAMIAKAQNKLKKVEAVIAKAKENSK